MSVPEAWSRAEYALLHGEDGEGRLEALEAWKARHVDPEWAEFSLSVCSEGCPWAEVQNALLESAPLGANRVVIVPQADNLLAKAKEIPPAIKQLLQSPVSETRLLLVSRTALQAGAGRVLGTKPFSEWVQQGRVHKVGALELKEAVGYLESQARSLGLQLEPGLAQRLAGRMGGHPGILRRTLEVLDLLAEDRKVTAAMIDQATFRLGEQGAFAWSQAWQKGQQAQALDCLRVALEDDPASAPLMLLGQARREVERLCRLVEARAEGLQGSQDLMGALGLSPKQGFLLDGYVRTLDRVRPEGARQLLDRVVQTDLDLKGMTLAPDGPLLGLTLALCRAWGG
nr:hypothetical protein [uncultured Holophaga sp.]